MSEFRLSFPAWFLAGKSRLSAEDVLTLRRVNFPDGVRTSDEAALLLAIHHSLPEKCAEWHGFFIEALTDFTVHRTHPQGSLDETGIVWLTQVISSNGVIHTATEFEVLMHVMDSAKTSPALNAFALDQLRYALSDNLGAYGRMRNVDARGITGNDLDFIAHVLCRASGATGDRLSPVEIQALERIDRAVISQTNHPGWTELLDKVRRQHAAAPRTRWLRVPDHMLTDAA